MITLQQRRDRIAAIGEALYGKTWPTRLSVGLGMHRTYIPVTLREQPMPLDLEQRIADLAVERIAELRRSADAAEALLPPLLDAVEA